VPSITVNGKGLITAASSSAYQDGSATQKGVVQVDGTTITASGGVITAVGSAATSIAVGTTTISSGTSGAFLYDSGGTLGNASPATKSDQQTGSSTTAVVTPAHQKDHDSAAKAWAYVTSSGGTYTVQTSYNVTSVSKTSTGRLTVNLTTAFSSVNFACIVSSDGFRFVAAFPASSSAITVNLNDPSSNPSDAGFSIACYGRQ
jgi:hypothetical protein